ncbi:predicted protein [Lichtheimia corymbifera JMRC:FSU:9682]|uniref:Uncharacterized protein n=1 Tax=Lichtheimia corymbifera JMRC:FSU:9682 TaxID=1263082 RepID=A0A068RI13_9FUNG|nr:predicted protein [Lichtheimia corymbifera JMRC:FSU:9682]
MCVGITRCSYHVTLVAYAGGRPLVEFQIFTLFHSHQHTRKDPLHEVNDTPWIVMADGAIGSACSMVSITRDQLSGARAYLISIETDHQSICAMYHAILNPSRSWWTTIPPPNNYYIKARLLSSILLLISFINRLFIESLLFVLQDCFDTGGVHCDIDSYSLMDSL